MSAHVEVLEPTVWQATKDLGTAIKRSFSFKRRQRRAATRTQAAVKQAAAAERAAEAAEKAATAAEKAEKALKTASTAAERAMAAAQAEQVAADKAAAEKEATKMAKQAELMRQKSLPGLPPRASDVRAAVDNLGGAIARSGRRRSSSVTFAATAAADGGPRGLKPSPKQPKNVVGLVRRATMGVTFVPDYLSVVNGADDAVELPPRASAVARSVDPLKRTVSDETETDMLPQPPPRASLVSQAVTRLVSRRSSGIPPLPPRASDVKAAVGSSRRERRAMRRVLSRGHVAKRLSDGGTGGRVLSDSEAKASPPFTPPPPSASEIAAAVRNL